MPSCSCVSCPHHTVVCFLFHSPIVSSFLSQSFFLSHKYTISNIDSLHPPTYSLFYSTISVFHSQTHVFFFLSLEHVLFPPQHTTSLPSPREILSLLFHFDTSLIHSHMCVSAWSYTALEIGRTLFSPTILRCILRDWEAKTIIYQFASWFRKKIIELWSWKFDGTTRILYFNLTQCAIKLQMWRTHSLHSEFIVLQILTVFPYLNEI